MKVKTLILLAALALSAAALVLPPLPKVAMAAEESWKQEFDALCGRTEESASMGLEELKKAIARCDALRPQIERLEETPRKVYLKRLQMCRNLFTYLLEGKEKRP